MTELDKNFAFLIDEYPEIYRDCKNMDLAIFDEEYHMAFFNAGAAVEKTLKKHLKLDYNIRKTLGELFYSKIKDKSLEEQKYINKNIKDYIKDLIQPYNNAKHNVHNFSKGEAITIAKRTQKIIIFFLFKNDLEIDYEPLTEENPFIKKNRSIVKYIEDPEQRQKIDFLYNQYIEMENKRISDINELNDKIKELNSEDISEELNEKIELLNKGLKELENKTYDTEITEEIITTFIKENNIKLNDNLNNKYLELDNKLTHIQEEKNIKDNATYELINSILIELDKSKNEIPEKLQNQINDVKNKFTKLNNDKECNKKLINNMIEKAIDGLKKENKDNLTYSFVNEINDLYDKNITIIRYPKKEIKEIKTKNKEEREPNNKQKEAIESDADKLIIDAGPGAGKTFVIIERVKHLLNRKNNPVNPESLVIITFNTKAAEELKERLNDEKSLNRDVISKMQISTIHSFCMKLLKDYSAIDVNILSDEQKKMFIKDKLDFTGINYIPKYEFKKVYERFEECSTFSVDIDKWIENIKENYFVGEEKEDKEFCDYINSIIEKEGNNFLFPEEEIRNHHIFNKRWYAHKYLAIAEGYKQYREELIKAHKYDFYTLQLRARDFLKENTEKIRFTNFLIDEFQDIDPIQKEIFEELLNISETFTIVGDTDQCIYGFRGSKSDLFKEFTKKGFEKIILEENYRTGPKLVKYNEEFINIIRSDRKKSLKSANENTISDIYYLNNTSESDEALNIVNSIKILKEKNNLKYKDFGLLFRTTKLYKLEAIINQLKNEGIPYSIKGINDLDIYPEVRSIMSLLWYLTKNVNSKEFNLDSFIELFNVNNYINSIYQPLFTFSKSTINCLNKFQGSVKELSEMNEIELESLGITSLKDLTFFKELNNLKRKFYNTNDNNLDVLGVYNNLFYITKFVDNQFEIPKENNPQLLNLALISRIIKDYIDIVGGYDLDSLYEYLISNYELYSSPYNENDEEDAVQLMTIHKSKGLEFPVVILCSLENKKFPKEFQKKEKDINYSSIKLEYPVDDKFLLNKEEIGKREHKNEEKRIIYVGLTRAKNLIILSILPHYSSVNESINYFDRPCSYYGKELKELTNEKSEDIDFIKSEIYPFNNELNLSFSSLTEYNNCKHKYDLLYNYGFKIEENTAIRTGTVVHDILNKIHIKAKNDEVTEEYIYNTIENIKKSNPDLENNEESDYILEQIPRYWEEFGKEWKILDSELPFTIKDNYYNLTGQIDLIIKSEDSENGITLIDFKTSDEESLDRQETKEKYLRQLHLYCYALQNNPEYQDYEIDNIMIFSMSECYPFKYRLDSELINSIKEDMDYAVDLMNEGIFDKNISSCRQCKMKKLCNIKDKGDFL